FLHLVGILKQLFTQGGGQLHLRPFQGAVLVGDVFRMVSVEIFGSFFRAEAGGRQFPVDNVPQVFIQAAHVHDLFRALGSVEGNHFVFLGRHLESPRFVVVLGRQMEIVALILVGVVVDVGVEDVIAVVVLWDGFGQLAGAFFDPSAVNGKDNDIIGSGLGFDGED